MAKKKINTLQGSKLNYNAGIQARYVKDLRTLIDKMVDETHSKIKRLFESNTSEEFFENQKEMSAMDASIASQAKMLTDELTKKFTQLFSKKAKPLADNMIKQTDKVSSSNLSESLKKIGEGLTFKTNFMTAGLGEIVKATVSENVALIKSIPIDYLSRVQKAVMRSITTGNGLKDLIPALNKYKGITYRHAKNMALDQTRKAYNSINKGRMEKIGVKQFKWLHSGGGLEPRKDHIAMNGKIYSFDDLPVIDKRTGERGIPGQAINCRCTMVPVINFED